MSFRRTLAPVLAAVSVSLMATVATALIPVPAGPSGWEVTHEYQSGLVADSSRPVVLMIHGLAASKRTFIDPRSQWNLTKLRYDPKASNSPAASIDTDFELAVSPAPPSHNLYSTLNASNMGVATWNQVPCIYATNGGMPKDSCLAGDLFEQAYKTAQWALKKLVSETKGPIALLAHSRGGLIVRRLLKEHGNVNGRIKWAITLHTPHGGTDVATKPESRYNALVGGLSKLIRDTSAAKVMGPLSQFKKFLLKVARLPGARELAANSVPAQVRGGEKPVAGLRYATFGGTSTHVLKAFWSIWTLGGTSTGSQTYFTNKVFAETTHGLGDTVITDASAKLSHIPSKHFSFAVHHSEVLWHQQAIFKVRDIIDGKVAITPIPEPPTAPISKTGGKLLSYAHGRPGGVRGKRVSGGKKINTGWHQFSHVFGGQGGVIYAVKTNGDLLWHSGGKGGNGKIIGSGFNAYNKVFGGADGVIYARDKYNGDLVWFKDTTRDGTGTVVGPKKIAQGWQVYTQLTGGEDGVIYTVDGNGDLYCHKDVNRDGTAKWIKRGLTSMWSGFVQVFGGADGWIYTVSAKGRMHAHNHLNRSTCKAGWAPGSGAKVMKSGAHTKYWLGGADGRLYAITKQ